MMRTEKSAIDSTLTLDELTVAIRNGIDKEGMPDEQAKEMAQHILNFWVQRTDNRQHPRAGG